jgi:NitT/TauT family transport system ATP-binding protein
MLSIRGIGKTFGPPTAPPVLAAVDLDIPRGEFLCLLGGSGCGKSTLLNIVAGFEQPSEGDIRLDGTAVTRAGPDRVMFFQNADAALFPWLTAAENVAFGLSLRGRPRADIVERHLRLVGLWDHRDKLPKQLSGGMKQRIQIARGLAIDPQILLMDEPFAALDAITRRLMHKELLRIWQATGKTIVFVTHDVAEAVALADRVGVMSRGPSARVKALIPIDLPRPRDPGTPQFAAAYAQIESLLMPEAVDPDA